MRIAQSQGGSREVVVVPQVAIVLHHATHEVQEWLSFHLAGYTLDPGPVEMLAIVSTLWKKLLIAYLVMFS